MTDEKRIERLSAMLKRRGFVLPAFEIYGGVSGLIDYGPVGASIRRKVIQNWVEHWTINGDIVEINSPTITPEPVLIASGHVGEFNDLMTQCGKCSGAFRADQLAENHHPNPDTLDAEEIDEILASNGIECPNCGEEEWIASKPMNLMFGTKIGAMKASRQAYMRPETAQGMFMLYPSLYRHFRQKLPFGAIQTGKGYRNEISPRQGMIRLREFNMAELEYFIDPENPPLMDISMKKEMICLIPDPKGNERKEMQISFFDANNQGIIKDQVVAYFLSRTWDFLINVGINPSKIRFRQHEGTEMAHYAEDCWDCEILGGHGWIECVGIANRTCHDLLSHEKYSNSSSLRAWREFEEPRVESKEVLAAKTSVLGPMFRAKAGLVLEALQELEKLPSKLPFHLEIKDGTKIEITAEMVERKKIQKKIAGEWFTPHVIEPAFGIDRIIWHILDHAYEETEKEGEKYNLLRLPESVAPADVIVLPLFEKDGMGDAARKLNLQINGMKGITALIDSSKSIGRRYARADEIGIPWAITIDHTTLEDGTVTVRRRDDQKQVRIEIKELLNLINSGNVSSLF
ncbi:MAG: glycine--tRNA ligase [Candidatus Poseidoniales archaeon]|jgi:glycyl-tRNA synthetase|nr:glycine--tRNA ligase [Candidatus Poseidoniales archaeon]|tara:strand:- start:321 stop:2039 length:1719 start_codon:yes stop_codon:yes gene_type:complete